jgi:general secretion pathway protein H
MGKTLTLHLLPPKLSRLPEPRLGLTAPGGFTLLELLIVLFLATLLLGLSVPFFAGALPSARLGATAREISSAMRQMKVMAENRGEDQMLTINLDTREYGIDGVKMKRVAPEIIISAVDPDYGEIRTGKHFFAFYATGSSDGGRIILSHKKKSIYLDLDPVVGVVTSRQ